MEMEKSDIRAPHNWGDRARTMMVNPPPARRAPPLHVLYSISGSDFILLWAKNGMDGTI